MHRNSKHPNLSHGGDPDEGWALGTVGRVSTFLRGLSPESDHLFEEFVSGE